MDLNSLMSTLLSSESIQGMSGKTGASVSQVKGVLGSALPALLTGAGAQSSNADTAESFANALTQHAANSTSSLPGFFGGVDLADGEKIVSHLLGGNLQSTTAAASQSAGTSTAQTGSILSAAAPLLMSLLGQQTAATQQQEETASPISVLMGNLLGGADLGGLTSGLLGAVSTNTEEKPAAKPASGGLLGILGKLFK